MFVASIGFLRVLVTTSVSERVQKNNEKYPSKERKSHVSPYSELLYSSLKIKVFTLYLIKASFSLSEPKRTGFSSAEMRLHVERVLLCLITLFWTQQTFIVGIDAHSGTFEANRWCCACSRADQANLSSPVPAICYSSCNCTYDSLSEGEWFCNCTAADLPKVNFGNDDTSCFASCNCTSGTSTEFHLTEKWMSSKILLLALLLCVVLTSLVFIVSLLCYLYLKDRWWPLLSSDNQSSCNSATSLISQRASVPMCKGPFCFAIQSFAGCLPKASVLAKMKISAIHGVIVQFSYSELEFATNKFSDSNLIGVGGTSHVYRGFLKDGKIVAVKRMNTLEGPEAESGFLTEIELISRLHHCHLVTLLGYCSERQGNYAERLLVFEYMSNGNLRDCLDKNSEKTLDWSTRVTIALGAARGLEYLHEAAAPRILHRDVKSTNVLLDENWRAKITDLGMAKHFYQDETPSCSGSPARMQGTFGYFAPEYAIVGRASLKSDVFSFGVVLLELITGKPAIWTSPKKVEESLVIWASPRLQDSRQVISELPDPKLAGAFDKEEMYVMAYLAKECLLLDPNCRPTMSEVVQVLSTIAPEKSRGKNMSVHIFQSSSYCLKEKEDIKWSHPVESEDIKYVMTDKQITTDCSLLSESPGEYSLQSKRIGKETEHFAIEDLGKIRVPLSNGRRSWEEQDDVEVVDLTEPRFESFCVFNVD